MGDIREFELCEKVLQYKNFELLVNFQISKVQIIQQ